MRNHLGFGGFWCRHCTGRILENEFYVEVDPNTRKKTKKVELTCTLCARNYRTDFESYKGLLDNIERILIRKKAAKNNTKQVLS